MKQDNLSLEKIWTLMPQLLALAEKAGDTIMEVYQSELSVDYKEDRSPVTQADLRSTEIIVEELKRITPQIPVICEETDEMSYDQRKLFHQIWIVDPLDGTKEFISKNDEFVVNIALVQDGEPIAGIIHAPVTKICYYAVKGFGAFKNDGSKPVQRLLLTEKIEAGQTIRVGVSRSHISYEDKAFIEGLRFKYPSLQTISFGSAFKFGLLAEGKIDIYPKFGKTMEWDTCSGQIIVEEAGAKLLNTETNQPLKYNKENTRNPFFIASRKELTGLL